MAENAFGQRSDGRTAHWHREASLAKILHQWYASWYLLVCCVLVAKDGNQKTTLLLLAKIEKNSESKWVVSARKETDLIIEKRED